MGLLAWVMMGLALWHFTIWLPDRYWGGIVGAFLGAVAGAALVGLIIAGFTIPGRHTTHLGTALEGIPGALIGMAVVYAIGVMREQRQPQPRT
jgi:hypothetical protein